MLVVVKDMPLIPPLHFRHRADHAQYAGVESPIQHQLDKKAAELVRERRHGSCSPCS